MEEEGGSESPSLHSLNPSSADDFSTGEEREFEIKISQDKKDKQKEPETDEDDEEEDDEEYEDTLEGRIKKRLRWKKKMKQLRDLGRLQRWRKKKTKPYKILLNDYAANRRKRYPSNFISTSKYTWWNFIFKLLYDQFTKVSNCYFLLIIVLQFIPGLSPLFPITSILPLAFVIIVAGVKEAIEDFFRHKEDLKNNRKKYDVIRDGHADTTRVASQNIRPGDIVIVKDGKQVPADMLVLATSAPDGTCYITTANLDGETNLKLRKAVDQTAKLGLDPERFAALRGKVMCEPPNEHLYHFIGTYCPMVADEDEDFDIESPSSGDESKDKTKTYPLDEDQLILRGSQLRNTDAVYGLVVYAGKDTKMSLNLHSPPTKHSTVDKILSRLVYSLFVILLIVVVLCALGSGVWQRKNGEDSWYIDLDTELIVYMLSNVGTYLILLSNFVPISLWVTLELVKVGQAKFMDWDLEMRSEDGKEGMKAKTSSLNEDLGRVQHIFSDKTGTLTENIMKFAKSSVGGVVYEELEPEKKEKKGTATETEVESTLEEEEIEETMKLSTLGSALFDVDEGEREDHPITHFLRVCSLCHAVVPETDKKTQKLIYRTPSPDEKALAETAAANGFQFIGRSTETLTVKEFGVEKSYDLLATLPFSADRRRMSVVIREPESEKIYLLIKGGDDVITARLSNDFDRTAIDTNNHHLRKFASEGLRTLVMAYREISEDAFLEFKERFDDAILSLDKEQRAILFNIAFDMVETDLELIGCSAIEDKLQDQVPETISYLLEAGIHVWVVTGDKQETAIEIGHSTRLLNEEMEKVILNATTQRGTKKLLDDYINKFGFREKERQRKELKRKSLSWRFWNYFKPKKPTDHQRFDDEEFEDEDEAEIEMEEIEEAKYGTPRPYEEHDDEEKELRPEPKQQQTPPRQHELQLGLVIDGETLKFALRPRLRKDFILLAKNCHAVICCRTSPLQKAMVVEAVKKGEKRICLAIGDGANDVSMLQKAHVGVGIFGKEGTQAARAADYAIHQFKHLKKLLCVHGRNSYIRSSGVVQYSFYKNICYNLIFVWFAFYSGFTGQTIFDSWVLGSFNVFFTSLPPLLLGLFERDISQETVYKYPQTYKKVQSGSVLTFWTFSGWMFAAIWHSLVCFFGTYWVFRNDILLTNGQTLDLWCMGEFAGTYLILVILTKVLVESSHWNWIVLLGVAASISFLWLFLIIYAALDVSPWFTNLYYVFYKCMSAASFWFLLWVVCIVCLLPDMIWKYVREQYFPDSWMILREQEIMEKWHNKRNKNSSPKAEKDANDGEDHFEMVEMTTDDDDDTYEN